MNLRDSPEEAAFRARVRGWLEQNLPAEPGFEWSQKMHEAGFVGITWPDEYGGKGAPYSHQAIVLEEFARAEAPNHMNVIGLGMAGPTIMAHGTEKQKRRYLPKILSAEEIWCQGFSEPGAGSDLAAARTRIEPQNGHFLVNGQKVWSSYAHIAEIGGGWQVAMTTLLHERGTLGFALTGTLDAQVNKLIALTKKRAADDPIIRDRVAQEWIELQALKLTNYRSLTTLMQTGIPGPEGSGSKLHWSEQNQRLTKLAIEILEGEDDGYWRHQQLRSRGNTIEAGTSEILRNIIAERVLGLPRSR